MTLDPSNRGSAVGVHESFIAGSVGDPVTQADVDEVTRLGVRILDGLQQRIPTALGQFVLDGLRDKPASVPFELVDSFNKVSREGDRDALHGRHTDSMT